MILLFLAFFLFSVLQAHDDNAFWHLKIPTTGLCQLSSDCRLKYPYLPHHYHLWELAPKKGAGVTVGLIDTGIVREQLNKLPLLIDPFKNYNLVSKNGKEFERLKITLQQALRQPMRNEIASEELLSSFIFRVLQNESFQDIIADFENMGYDPERLARVYTKIRSLFSLQKVESNGKEVIEQLLPITDSSFKSALHGTHIAGIIGGTVEQPIGIAPNARICMIKAFDDYGMSDKSTLVAAVQKMAQSHIDIVNLSLKFIDPYCLYDRQLRQLEQALSTIPFVIAAAGNVHPELLLCQSKPSYPASATGITFDIGAFGLAENNCFIAPFSQKQSHNNFNIIAPGVDITSIGPAESFITFSGTSMASAIMSGFLALLYAEAKEYLSPDQIKNIIYASAFQPHNTDEWCLKSSVIIDMRTALLIAQILITIHKLWNNKQLFNEYFNYLLRTTMILLIEPMYYFGLRHYTIDPQFKFSYFDTIWFAQRVKNELIEKKPVGTVIFDIVHAIFENMKKTAGGKCLHNIYYQTIYLLFKPSANVPLYPCFLSR